MLPVDRFVPNRLGILRAGRQSVRVDAGWGTSEFAIARGGSWVFDPQGHVPLLKKSSNANKVANDLDGLRLRLRPSGLPEDRLGFSHDSEFQDVNRFLDANHLHRLDGFAGEAEADEGHAIREVPLDALDGAAGRLQLFVQELGQELKVRLWVVVKVALRLQIVIIEMDLDGGEDGGDTLIF